MMPTILPIFLFFYFFSSLFWWVIALSSANDFVGLHRNDKLPILTFDEGYTRVFGDDNLMLLRDGKAVQLSLDERTGAGFASQDLYLNGFFSASIKLSSAYSTGVVVAFYLSNGDTFEKTHDELDFEFLGNIRGKDWRIQTNVYGNGSTSTGREERYRMWFDPTEDFHQYSILWTKEQIVFSIDDIPIREFTRSAAMGGVFPSKPMSTYATIWDGSDWATSGGRYKTNYKYGPYVAEFSNLILQGCAVDPMDHHSSTCDDFDQRSLDDKYALSINQRLAMDRFRKEHLTYSYCYDRQRYRTPPPECASRAVKNFHINVKYNKFGFRRRHVKHGIKRRAAN